MAGLRWISASAILMVTLFVAACGSEAPRPSPTYAFPTFAAFPSLNVGASAGTPEPTSLEPGTTDLSAIGCATADPTDVGELTGAWIGDDGGRYWIRQVGDCVWWFGTEVDAVERGALGQEGFANVASGRIDGTRVDVEFADLPLGDVLGGGGLTLTYDAENDQLTIVEQRGDWQTYGATTLTRIVPDPSPSAGASESPPP